ncbi:arabinan endo-1,5-alpha-L-arabinosidase [Paenibacillus jilunlii]|uniref:Arabinan endo-1,5-alpha-L-arabinosidase n=1 Tax=Paenibacillus jilunlii TaxID=682956 RepID=A0A1G9H7C0_9BACL|nr:hypothetical protein AML91_07730 [Paenibacillus jilunlii]SDL08886.1 arabinan endo-1,5-alpha-L-arabinosidase [Paenibacillus jilunlii]
MGSFQFMNTLDDLEASGTVYVSPGHNSAYYDDKSGQYYLIFHTRFRQFRRQGSPCGEVMRLW